MTLDQPVVLAHAGALERSALCDEITDVRFNIDALLSRKLLECAGQLQQHIIERRLRGGEREPVGVPGEFRAVPADPVERFPPSRTRAGTPRLRDRLAPVAAAASRRAG